MAGRLQLEQGGGVLHEGAGYRMAVVQGDPTSRRILFIAQHDIGHLEIWKSPFCIFRANVEILMILYPGGMV